MNCFWRRFDSAQLKLEFRSRRRGPRRGAAARRTFEQELDSPPRKSRKNNVNNFFERMETFGETATF